MLKLANHPKDGTREVCDSYISEGVALLASPPPDAVSQVMSGALLEADGCDN